MSYDPKCKVLAADFLSTVDGDLEDREGAEIALAAHIQDAIEEWIEFDSASYRKRASK